MRRAGGRAAPSCDAAFDDKFETNALLRGEGLPAAKSIRIGRSIPADLCAAGAFPQVVKPVRGRGSQGVRLVHDSAERRAALKALFADGGFGDTVMVEEALPGEEMTVTVMPPGAPKPGGSTPDRWWALPPVRRRGHRTGVMPYSGDVAVARNSAALPAGEAHSPEIAAMVAACVAAAGLVDARAPIRIDSRADAAGHFLLFDLNMKPNLTGAGRPGREDQDSLVTLAAHAAGWTYADLLLSMLGAAWRFPS